MSGVPTSPIRVLPPRGDASDAPRTEAAVPPRPSTGPGPGPGPGSGSGVGADASAARIARWRPVRNVLAIRLDNLGDVLMTTPALRAIRHAHPDMRVTLLTSTAAARALPHLAEVDDAIAHDAPWVSPERAAADTDDPRAHADAQRAIVDRIVAMRFDAAVIFTVYTQSALPAALLTLLAGIPLRLAHARENPYRLLTDWIPDPEPGRQVRHEVRRQLDLVATVGWTPPHEALGFRVRAADRTTVADRLAACGIGGDEALLVVHPGATAPSRRYPAASFASACRAIRARSRVRIVVTGSEGESALVEEVVRTVPQAVPFAGNLSLGEFGALVERATLVLGNNTGPAHVAAALGTPVVELYALTNPQHTPWLVDARVLSHDVDCRWCQRSVCPSGHHECLRGVPPERVADAVLELLALPRRRPARPAAPTLVQFPPIRPSPSASREVSR